MLKIKIDFKPHHIMNRIKQSKSFGFNCNCYVNIIIAKTTQNQLVNKSKHIATRFLEFIYIHIVNKSEKLIKSNFILYSRHIKQSKSRSKIHMKPNWDNRMAFELAFQAPLQFRSEACIHINICCPLLSSEIVQNATGKLRETTKNWALEKFISTTTVFDTCKFGFILGFSNRQFKPGKIINKLDRFTHALGAAHAVFKNLLSTSSHWLGFI